MFYRCGLTRSLCLALAASACGGTAAPSPEVHVVDRPPAFAPLDTPAAEDSAHPQLTSSSAGAILSWLEQGETTTTLRFSERTAGRWSEPLTVSSGEEWFVTAADVPSVLRLKSGTLVANWYPATDATNEAYDTYLTYSRDDGQSWARPFSPHHDGTTTQHGFAFPLELADGGLGLFWLDGRDQAATDTNAPAGAMGLYFASFDAAWKQTAESVVNARVCECCQTAAVLTADGVLAAFRDRSTDEVRDVRVARLENGQWTERPLHDDNWRIAACPVNGPALSARGRQVTAAWFTAPDEKGRAFVAFSQDAGKTWGNPIRLDEQASLGRVDVELLDDGSAVASWIEMVDRRSHLMVRRVSSSGERSQAVDVSGDGRPSGYPRLARSGGDLILAWTDSAMGQQVKAAVVHVQQ